MAHRVAAFLALICVLFVSAPASADGPAAYSFTPGTVFLATNWRPDEQGIWRFDSIVLKPDGCLLREFAFKDAGPQTVDTACHLTFGDFPTPGKTGVFAISVDFAGHSQQIIFRTTPTSIGPSPYDNPSLSGMLLGFHGSMASPPPAVDVQRTDQWRSAASPTVHEVFHLVTHGLDCEFEIVGLGSTPCALSSWSERDVSVLVSGSFFHQPDPILHVEASLMAQGWVMAPVAYRPYSPLNLAILHGDLQAVNALLAQKGNPGISDTDLEDALRTALAGHVDIAKTLVDHGAPLNSATQYQVPVLSLAASLGASGKVSDRARAMDLVQDMVAHGASVTQNGSSSLFYAIGANDPAMVEFLLDHGADVNAQTYRGSTQISAYEDAMGNATILDVLLR
ncbi:MAG TPA: hypothetical protein VFK21_03605, partial [Gammaproteobacteria bacterium]|nr:hypothetical protein [Gammaproteobacteria bacterium]